MHNFNDWGIFKLPSNQPLIVAGPCSAETEEQLILSCKGAAEQGAHLLRAGIWKPRTRPDSFEGVGEVGLAWLKNASRITGLPVCTEVANAAHVEAALRHGIDVLWIGARTTVNPFAVQEIADALRGTDIPVFVKNPVNPDLELWLGAIERLEKVGIQKIAAVHRGFSVYGVTAYRNSPQWEIPVEFKRRRPDLSVICDPSHICGRRETIPAVAQTALDLGFDGLMMEVHTNPDGAWSDALQQFTPEDFGAVLKDLTVRTATSGNPLFLTKLEELRRQIDALDFEMVEIFARRMEIAREIGEYKKENGVAILQMERWQEVFQTRSKRLKELGLTPQFSMDLLTAIHKESITQQENVINVSCKL